MCHLLRQHKPLAMVHTFVCRFAQLLLLTRGGPKKMTIDLFGPWAAPDLHHLNRTLKSCKVPHPVVNMTDVLACNFEWSETGTLPYAVFEELRMNHEIDVTGLNMSRTHNGNLYRNYCLLHSRSA